MLGWLLERLGIGSPLKRADARLWAQARTLHDLCDLTAMWLEGHIDSQPGYWGKVDVDTAPSLREALIGLNRSGFLTHTSQKGFDGTGYDGAHWHSHAAVEGFADDDMVRWLEDVVSGTRMMMLVHPFKESQWGRGKPGVDVTFREGVACTRFGYQMGYQTIAGELYDRCSDEAIDALCRAWQVTVYDPDPGADDLWPLLCEAVSLRIG